MAVAHEMSKFLKILFCPKKTAIDLEKSQNYNEPGRTLHESSFVEIVAGRSLALLSLQVNILGNWNEYQA
ncbi:hypothetical protein T10_1004 [Trichinella papuae]|uniref:Uncharacterized protein n=1 Tax=Trichinella papuae TaxID=268474 RepID=A0A0V1M130_9BILA|nr:hypothetical protein T10_1004 [Trichinella papuae]